MPDFKHKDLDVNYPMFQSTPQQTSENIRKPGYLKRFIILIFLKYYFCSSNNPQTPGGRPISPIMEERREELDKLVSDVAKLHNVGGDKIVQNLVTQLRNLIAQWDWAQARHKHVAKIVRIITIIFFNFLIVKYFDRQQDELNANWENLHAEIAKFNQQKSDEYAKIASIRSGLQSDKVKATAKKDSDRIKELELQVFVVNFCCLKLFKGPKTKVKGTF